MEAAMAGIWIAMPSPQTPDCRGGVFATRRFPRPSHHARTPCPPRGNTIDGYGGGGAPMRIWVRGRL